MTTSTRSTLKADSGHETREAEAKSGRQIEGCYGGRERPKSGVGSGQDAENENAGKGGRGLLDPTFCATVSAMV